MFIYSILILGFEVEGCPTPQKADPNDMTEDERVAEMGKPRLGDITKIQIDITESEEFRVSQYKETPLLRQIQFNIMNPSNIMTFITFIKSLRYYPSRTSLQLEHLEIL